MTKLADVPADLPSRIAPSVAPAPTKGARRSHNRLPQLLDEAARVFARCGFAASSVREIVEPVGMLPGSLYYHFETKDELLAAVYSEGVRRISLRVDEAIAPVSEPWARLEAGCVAHLTAMLDRTDYSQVVIRIRPDDAPLVAAQLVQLRQSYERRFLALIDALPLPPSVHRRDLRLLLLGAMNWSQTWFDEDGPLVPAQIAQRFVGILKTNLQSPKG